MTAAELAINLALLVAIVFTQLGRRVVTRRRFTIPLIIVGVAALEYLRNVPTAGDDVPFYVIGAAAGAGFALLASLFVRVERDASGDIVARTGVMYAVIWLVVIGGRIAFAEAATHTSFGQTVGSFSRAESITGPGAWQAMFVLMALAMVLTRVAVLGARSAQLRLEARAARSG
jgi:RsiW-degrading membrane proteinase PrsW (M82 family)